MIFACEKAVQLAPENGHIRDSHGLARAMTGNRLGAIEDFQALIKYFDEIESKLDEEDKLQWHQHILQRKRWIEALRNGANPFTEEELERLRNE